MTEFQCALCTDAEATEFRESTGGLGNSIREDTPAEIDALAVTIPLCGQCDARVEQLLSELNDYETQLGAKRELERVVDELNSQIIETASNH